MKGTTNEILGKAKTIRELLSGTKYSTDFYQREYKWQTKHVRELLEDLTSKFLDDYQPAHAREDIQAYGHYFLGSIILSNNLTKNFVIDGQQRLTTLTLLLIYLHNRQGDRPNKVKLDDLIFSEKFGRKSFNIDVEERTACMEALYNHRPFEETEQQSESVRNIIGRYQDIEQYFPPEVGEEALPYFADWLIENVHLVEITAYSDEDAYTIFETMNDRGLSLTPTDMLKGYLLAKITDQHQKIQASNIWKERTNALMQLGKDENADAIKAWLRSQHAQTIRDRKKGAKPGDFDRLGAEFHRWVREHDEALALKRSVDFAKFIEHDFAFYTKQYERLRLAAMNLTEGLECVFYNAQYEFTLQYPLLLAPLTSGDSPTLIDRKLRVVSRFVDILLARRQWNSSTISYNTMQHAMFRVMCEIRGKGPTDLVEILSRRLETDTKPFSSNRRLGLHAQNGSVIKLFLARITDHVEHESDQPSQYLDYISGRGKKRYEIEHIWSDHPEKYGHEFPNPTDFADYRNRVGGLLLLPKSFNASFGDMDYEDKLEHYFGQNLLAKSLHPKCYDHNPRFIWYVKRSKLPFNSHPHFEKADLDARQELYQKIVEEIWSTDRLEQDSK
jgi:uncharacterized protein with ParB-like and HNH nuclease domain